MFKIKRFVDPNTGWGAEVGWGRPAAECKWFYRLRLYGVHHPGAWSRMTLWAYKCPLPGSYRLTTLEWIVGSPVFCDLCEVTSHKPTRFSGNPNWNPDNIVRFPAVPCREFWKLAQAVRQQKDQGAAAALVDWLCENGPGFLTEILQEGPPLGREVGAAREGQEVRDLVPDVGGDDRVTPV